MRLDEIGGDLAMYQEKHFGAADSGEEIRSVILSKHLNILIIDDEDNFRKSMCFNLRRIYGARVVDLDSGSEAIDYLKRENSFDIIFIDIMMPRMNGVVTYQNLKKIGAKGVMVLMSVYIGTKEWEEAKELDVEMYAKPIPEEKMARILFNVANHLS
jgi:CheY-like chemotaxis protein